MSTNGSSVANPAAGLSPAEQLRARHAAQAVSENDHHVTVEDAEDEEDIAHPVPSAHLHDNHGDSALPMSDVAKGKQKAAPTKPLNVDSEEAFPSLAAPRPTATAASQSWGRPPASAANGRSANGSPAPTRAPGAPVNLPGRHVERIALRKDQILTKEQLKKPIQEVIRDINKKSKARITVGQQGPHFVFEGTGPVDAVRHALKEVVSQVGSKQTVTKLVPASVRPHIIGRQGQTIQNLSKNTGARITVSKSEDNPSAADDDDDPQVEVKIEGDAVAASLALNQIEAIINERSANMDTRLRDIPAEFYPFLVGPRESNLRRIIGGQNVNVSIPHYHTWQQSAPPQPASEGAFPQFHPQASLPIRISGDRQAAQAVRQQIEAQVQALRPNLTSQQLPVERARHQFIVGKNGDAIHDILEQTGCTVVAPPTHEDSEALYIIGPSDKIEQAVEHILDIASSMAVQNVDPARAHPRAPPTHAYDLMRYLQQREALAAIEQQYEASISLPTSSQSAAPWQIFSRDGKQGMRARADVMNLISAHPPTRFHPLEVHPFYHQHLRNRTAPQLRRSHGVHLLFPSESDSPNLVLVYESPGAPSDYEFPRQAPTQSEVQEHQKAIQAAVQQLLGIVGDNDDVVSRDLNAPPKFHEKIQRYVDREQRSLPEHQIPIQLLFPRTRGPQTGEFQIRGTGKEVDDLNAKILEFIEQEKRDEVERGFTMTVDYPHKFANVLIGRNGDNIKKLEQEYDVEVHYQEGKVELKGPKAKCEAAKSHIASLAKKLEDEATHNIKIPQQYHADLKGSKGSQVIRLQDRYNVRINFPRHVPAPGDDADAATEGSVKNYSNQPPDVVIIRGPRKGADDARDELLSLLQYARDTSHTDVVSVAQRQIPSIIGAGGRELDALRLTTGCKIDIPKKEDADESGRVEIRLKGTKKQVEEAKKLLKELATVFDDTVVKKLEVDPKFYKAIIGPSGSTLREIVVNAGGPDDNRQLNRIVQLPKPGASDGHIKIEGRRDVVEKIVAAIEKKVSEIGSHVTETLVVVPEQQRLLIGAGGSKRRDIEDKFNVTLNIPKQETKGAERTHVKLTGRPEHVEKAKAHIESILKEQASDTIQVPKSYHHTIADDGNFFRRLRSDHRVTVDHDGSPIPPKPATAGASRSRNVNGSSGALPLITDEASGETHSWELVDYAPANGSAADDDETIPWVLRGNADNLAKARAAIEKAIESAKKPSATGYLILPDSKLYRHVIGPGGSTINGIRSKTGTHITVPRQGSADEAIEIKGTKDGVEAAKDLVLEAVEKGSQQRKR